MAPLLIAAALAIHVRGGLDRSPSLAPTPLQVLDVAQAARLRTLFDSLDYSWPPAGPVPAVTLARLPEDLDALPVAERKTVFLRTLLPLVLAENAAIKKQRAFVLAQFAAAGEASASDRAALAKIAAHYGITDSLSEPAVRRRLLRRVDVLPPALVLAQAAKESGWGTSYFAREANNLFGVWTWQPDEGLAPRALGAKARHFVRVFADLRASVRAYLYNINVGHAYVELRKIRARLRAKGKLRALPLVAALDRYSAHGERYNRAIRAIIKQNGLDRLGAADLRLAKN
jgi:Bax protein